MSSTTDPGQTARRVALAVLAACAALAAMFPELETPRTPPIAFPAIALGLGVGAIVCRQQALVSARRGQSAFAASIAVFALAAGIGVVGLALVWIEGQRQTALLYAAGGAILALRPLRAIPPVVPPASRPSARASTREGDAESNP